MEKILLCCHKLVQIPHDVHFIPIQVGRDLSKIDLGFVSDNTGDHISNKNRNYCELTAQYWAWKNLKGIDIIGLNHYRRFFDFNIRFPRLSPELNFVDMNEFKQNYSLPDLSNILKKFDIILPNRSCHPYSNSKHYCCCHLENDWIILRQVIRELYPEYYSAFVKTMDKCNEMSDFNMFITSWEIFDQYCSWLFPVLFEVEKRVKISEYDNQARIFGFMSERLINVYCEKEKLKIKHYPVIMPIEEFSPSKNTSLLSFNYRKLRYRLAYKLSY